MTITIRKLAGELGLSITTVSRALDGYPDVSADTRRRVSDLAVKLGYEPTFAARMLRRKRADALGYILPAVSPRFSDPFYSDFLNGLCDQAAEEQMDLVVSSCPPDSRREQTLYRHWTLSKRVDGVILNRVRLKDWRIAFLRENGVPFAALGGCGQDLNTPCAVVEDREGMSALVRYLAAKGHRRFAYIGGPDDLVVSVERRLGFLDGLESCGIEPGENVELRGDLTEEGGYAAASELLRRSSRPTAIVCCNDLTALGVLRGVRAAGLNPGVDVAVTGFDGIREAEYANPPLTTLSQPTYEIARNLIRSLIQQINGEAPQASLVKIYKPQLVLRASSG